VQGMEQRRPSQEDPEYGKIIGWFEAGNKIEIADTMPIDEYYRELEKVKGLSEITKRRMNLSGDDKYELAAAMEFTLDGLHQFSKIAKDEVDHIVEYKDLVGSIFGGKKTMEDDD